MLKNRLIVLLIAGLLAAFSTGCLLSVEPESAENPVGTEHTVTATLLNPETIGEEEFCENFFDELENYEEEDFNEDELFIVDALFSICQGQGGGGGAVLPADHNLVNFEIISGPNAGLNSDENGECEPSCNLPDANDQVSWTYQSNGIAGTDVIEVCVDFTTELPPIDPTDVSASQFFPPGFETVEDLLRDVLNETFDTDFDSFEDFFCQTVEKTWVEFTPTPEPEDREAPLRPRPPSIGAGLSGLFQGQPTPLPTAVAPVATTQVIRPPSTGDAGLK